jgi:pSer/pThr/pTyr-binding forkhead associated (FHA) protein
VAKIILMNGDAIMREIQLAKERITIGRRPHNDIVINDLAISADHAVIVTAQRDSYLEDLNSTNGTQINGQPVRKHFLQDGDVIELAQYKIRYLAHAGEDNADITNAISAPAAIPQRIPKITVLNGAKAGKEVRLAKVLTTLGRPGVQVAVITRRQDGYYLNHIEGADHPIVNGRPIGDGAHHMMHDDVIELSGTRIRFSLD